MTLIKRHELANQLIEQCLRLAATMTIDDKLVSNKKYKAIRSSMHAALKS